MEVKIETVCDLLGRYQMMLEELEGARMKLRSMDVRLGGELASLVEIQRELDRLMVRGWEVV